MVIASLDIGKKGGVVIYNSETKEYLHKEPYSFTSLNNLYNNLSAWVETHKVELFIIGEAFGQRVVVKCHSKFYGVVELVAEQQNIPVYYISDCTARCVVLGKGNGRRKDLVQPYFEEKLGCALTPDEADAVLFVNGYLKQIGEEMF